MQELSTSPMNANVRWAWEHEGPIVQAILEDQKVDLARQVNWLLPLGPYWLLYCDPDPVACLMVLS